jgi:hypothetical protein
LSGAKGTWLAKYRDLKKVKKYNKSGMIDVSVCCQGDNDHHCHHCCLLFLVLLMAGVRFCVANLQQNPQSRAVVCRYLPTLLKGGLMWLLSTNPNDSDDIESNDKLMERPMLPKVRQCG